MPRIKLTKSAIDALSTPTLDVVYWDASLPGFGVKITPKGRKVVIGLYRTGGSGTVRLQAFCPRCGTGIYATTTGDEPKTYNIRLGAVRQRTELVPRLQIFVCSQQPWVNDIHSIPKSERMPPQWPPSTDARSDVNVS